MTDAPVLRAEGLGKRFQIYDSPWHRVLEWLGRGRKLRHRDLWAVRDLSFEIAPGQVFGIIGVNGAGKSSLVKLLTGVLDPTEGTFSTRGRVLSLPELGSDLNESLTGRQNVLVSSDLMGISREFIASKLDEIIEFSELGEFFDRHVKTYSTGMRMRLAFSMFAFLDCDLLILDEVMAVGDVFFQQKCYARIRQLVTQNTAILLVSHDLNAIQLYADQVMVLHQGRKIFQGDATGAIQAFVQLRGTRTARTVNSTFAAAAREDDSKPANDHAFDWPAPDAPAWLPIGNMRHNSRASLVRLALCDSGMRPTHAFKQQEFGVFCYEFQLDEDIGVPVGLLEISNAYDILLHSKNSLQLRADVPRAVRAGEHVRFSQRVQLGLEPGAYAFNLGLLSLHPDDYARIDELTQDELNDRLVWVSRHVRIGAFVVTFGFGRGLSLTHAGICDLPGSCQVQRAPSAEVAQPALIRA